MTKYLLLTIMILHYCFGVWSCSKGFWSITYCRCYRRHRISFRAQFFQMYSLFNIKVFYEFFLSNVEEWCHVFFNKPCTLMSGRQSYWGLSITNSWQCRFGVSCWQLSGLLMLFSCTIFRCSSRIVPHLYVGVFCWCVCIFVCVCLLTTSDW